MSEQAGKAVVVGPGEGRRYEMGRMTAIFKADQAETQSVMSVSEWWLEPNTEGPHTHQHPEAHLFYVLAGTLTVYLADRGWFPVEQGVYVFIPGNTAHAFENRSAATAGFMSINTPGGFEAMLPGIVGYFQQHPLGDVPPRDG